MLIAHLYNWPSISVGSIFMDSTNHESEIFLKIPHILKKQNLNLSHTGNYLHSIYTVLGINNLEMV